MRYRFLLSPILRGTRKARIWKTISLSKGRSSPTVYLGFIASDDRAWDSRSRLKEMGETAPADVRQWVSPDPSEDFVRELLALPDLASR